MMMQMLGSVAEFERAMARERIQAGLRSAHAQGRNGGRQPKLSPHQQAEVIAILTAGQIDSRYCSPLSPRGRLW
jgi:DNA invertase Pin-like site-specific DNA recombinase